MSYKEQTNTSNSYLLHKLPYYKKLESIMFSKGMQIPVRVKARCKAAQSCPAKSQVLYRCTKQGSDKGNYGALRDFLNSSTHLDPEAFQTYQLLITLNLDRLYLALR